MILPRQFWALLAAVFGSLTAIFAKIGVGAINCELATLVRSVVIMMLVAGIVGASGELRGLGAVVGRTCAFPVPSGLAPGASWICSIRALNLTEAGADCAYRQAERGAGGRLRHALPEGGAFGPPLGVVLARVGAILAAYNG